ncbi:hypothetical protein MMC10_000673 [Thelotrema lepadinum]|nr:hypothetical protein [Thelotrema lepadinum]
MGLSNGFESSSSLERRQTGQESLASENSQDKNEEYSESVSTSTSLNSPSTAGLESTKEAHYDSKPKDSLQAGQEASDSKAGQAAPISNQLSDFKIDFGPDVAIDTDWKKRLGSPSKEDFSQVMSSPASAAPAANSPHEEHVLEKELETSAESKAPLVEEMATDDRSAPVSGSSPAAAQRTEKDEDSKVNEDPIPTKQTGEDQSSKPDEDRASTQSGIEDKNSGTNEEPISMQSPKIEQSVPIPVYQELESSQTSFDEGKEVVPTQHMQPGLELVADLQKLPPSKGQQLPGAEEGLEIVTQPYPDKETISPDLVAPNGVSPELVRLALTAKSGDLQSLSHCLAYLVNAKDIHTLVILRGERSGKTAFMRAAIQGSVDCLKEFAKHRLDCTVIDMNSRTALHHALEAGNSDAARWILFYCLQQNSNNAPSAQGRDNGGPQIASMEDKEGISAIHLAAGLCEDTTFQLLLDLGADINARDHLGSTPLHYAVEKQSSRTIELMLRRGVNINIANFSGQTPLILATIEEKVNVVQELLGGGADWLVRDAQGNCAIHYAAQNGNLNLLEMLFLAPEDLEIENHHGDCPMHLAASKNHSAMVQALLRVPSLNVNRWTKPRRKQAAASKGSLLEESVQLPSTPIHCACRNGSHDAAYLLITSGASVNGNQEGGISALMLACEANSFPSVELLLKKDANFDAATDKDGLTALHIACQKNNFEITKLLIDYGANTIAKMKNGNQETPVAYATRLNSPTELKAAKYVLERSIPAARAERAKHGGKGISPGRFGAYLTSKFTSRTATAEPDQPSPSQEAVPNRTDPAARSISASLSTPSAENDDPILTALMRMDFSREESVDALEKCDYNLNEVSLVPSLRSERL